MSSGGVLVMGTRGSPLALAQSRVFAKQLQTAYPDLRVEERIIRTTGDKQQGAPLPAIGGKGVFTLEIEDALQRGEIDFAVHSLKDLPPDLPEALVLACIPKRAAANDVCVLNPQRRATSSAGELLDYLREGARIGTSSLRRKVQLLYLRQDLQVEDVRGNIDTRLRKLVEQDFDAIVLARAGIERLELMAQLSVDTMRDFAEHEFVPAPGQGALAIQARKNDDGVTDILSTLECKETRACITAERTVMKSLDAGCSTPLGARARIEDGRLHLWAVVLSPDGRRRLFMKETAAIDGAEALGVKVGSRLLEQGAGELLSH